MAGLGGCGKPKPDVPVEDPRAYAMKALVGDGRDCFLRRRDLCLDEPKLVGAVLDECISKTKDEALPTMKSVLDRLIWRCRSSYKDAQLGIPERRAEILGRLRKQYDDPDIYVKGGVVYADAGEVPRQMHQRARTGTWELSGSGEDTRGEDLEPEAVRRRLLALRAAHPEAKRLVLHVEIPDTMRNSKHRLYYWLLDEDKLGVVRGSEVKVSKTPAGKDLAQLEGLEGSFTSMTRTCRTATKQDYCPQWSPNRHDLEDLAKAAAK